MIWKTDTRFGKRVSDELGKLDAHFSQALDEAIEESLYTRFEERALQCDDQLRERVERLGERVQIKLPCEGGIVYAPYLREGRLIP